ncbi:excisionase [Streptosporangium sp. 'caverna']|nr:excisionase [Streptosporangium sp. 'caverna']AWS49118.1 excisionase [Streptosporangium sp. 'caverna']
MTVPRVLDELGGRSRRTFCLRRELGHAPTCVKPPDGEIRVGRSDFATRPDTLREAA